MHDIPEAFARRMVEVHGAAGRAWLERLPALLDDCAGRWSLALMPPLVPLSYNYVTPATRGDGREVILKVGVPHPELRTEIAALRLYDGRGAVRLLEALPERGALLMERLRPGTELVDLEDDAEATAIAARVMEQLWRPVPADHAFPTVARWAAGLERLRRHFGGSTGPFPAALVERAEALFAALLPSMEAPVLLHGDLHHYNILAAERQPWLAIDPKGVVGEPAYEVGALLRNPMPQIVDWPDAKRILAQRVDQLVDILGFDRERIAGWAVAQAVLSGWWSYEDHGHSWEPGFACAELLADL